MKNPDEESQGSDGDSSDYGRNFDFIVKAQNKIGKLFKAKTIGGKKNSKTDYVKKNDILLLNKLLEKAINHELDLSKAKGDILKSFENLKNV